ncbi:hypothetical protein GCM10009800_14880 [Nocardiopsis rhodophaea]
MKGSGGMPGPLAGGDIVISTESHPFWVPELQEWVDAGDLRPGMWLETSAGTWVQVTATRAWTQSAKVHNLTVEGVHTFNVAVGASSDVLTHNCGAIHQGRCTTTPIRLAMMESFRVERCIRLGRRIILRMHGMGMGNTLPTSSQELRRWASCLPHFFVFPGRAENSLITLRLTRGG